MKSLAWRLYGLDTLGTDLALLQIVGWAAAGDVMPSSIQASVAPVSGSLNELISGATAEVVFAGEDFDEFGAIHEGLPIERWIFVYIAYRQCSSSYSQE